MQDFDADCETVKAWREDLDKNILDRKKQCKEQRNIGRKKFK